MLLTFHVALKSNLNNPINVKSMEGGDRESGRSLVWKLVELKEAEAGGFPN